MATANQGFRRGEQEAPQGDSRSKEGPWGFPRAVHKALNEFAHESSFEVPAKSGRAFG